MDVVNLSLSIGIVPVEAAADGKRYRAQTGLGYVCGTCPGRVLFQLKKPSA